MTRQVFYIRPDGSKQSIVNSGTPELAGMRREKVSRIEPANLFLRLLYVTIRATQPEQGKVVAWLRTWRCKWRIHFLSNGRILQPFSRRQDAVDKEIELLEELLEQNNGQ